MPSIASNRIRSQSAAELRRKRFVPTRPRAGVEVADRALSVRTARVLARARRALEAGA